MKKLFTLFLTLAALLSSTQVLAESYDLYVGGKQVTDDNKNNITSSAITGGTVYYNPSSKVLFIGNGTDITREGDCINSSIDGLKIVFLGSATITSTSGASQDAGLYLSGETTITFSSGKSPVVTIKNTGAGNAIRTNNRLAILGNRLTATAANNDAIYGRSSGNLLVISYSSVFATGGSGKAGITGFQSIILTASVLHPDQTISGGTVMKGGSAAQAATINCAATIGGLNVSISSTTLSASNTGATSASGTATYNSSTKTLTLTNVNVNGANLETHGDMTINFVGGGTISSGGYTMDLYHGNTAITSDGTVTITSTGQNAVYVNGSYSLSINAPEFSALSTGSSRVGMFAGSGTVTLNKYSSSCVYKFAGTGGSFKVKNLVLKDMDISTDNTYWNPSDGYDYYNGSICKASTLNGGTWFQPTSSISYYNLWVAGTHVRQNSAKYIASPYMNVVASYDNSSKTLTLTDATISGQPSDGAAETRSAIYSTISGLTINATGTNNWTSDGITVNLGGGGTNTIKGTGDLLITSNQYHAMNAWNNTGIMLARSSGSMSLKGKNRGIYGNNTTTLTINKDGSGALYKFAGEEGNITNLSSLTFGSGVKIWTLYQYFNADEGAIYSRNTVAKSSSFDDATWIRSDVTWTTYPIYIAGTQLYGAPKGDGTYRGNIGGFWSKYVKGGEITYNPSTKTLTLNGAKIDKGDESFNCVYNDGLDGLIINVIGTNDLKSTGGSWSSLNFWANTTIQGTGTLNLTGSYGDLFASGSSTTVTINDVNLNAEKNIYGPSNESNRPKLAINMSTEGKKVTANYVYSWNTITLGENTAIVEPMKAVVSGGAIKVGSSNAQNVVIQKVEKYDLAICDIDVNSYNKDDILRDGGAFKYDPTMKRLTITNANVDDTSIAEGIWNKGIEGLNIAINGENNLKFYEDVFCLKKPTTFSGNGSVKGELESSSGYGIYLAADGVIGNINGPKLEFTAHKGVGDNGHDANLIIEKGCMVFNPKYSDSRILSIKNLTLGDGMIIAEPKGGTFSSSSKGIVVNGSLYYGHAVISMKGDVNLDGEVTIADGVAVLNAMSGEAVAGNADVNGDNDITIADFVAVLNLMAN